MFGGISSSSADKFSGSLIKVSDSKIGVNYTVIKSESLPNPSPANYRILRYQECFNFLAIEIQYLDCKNYEGRKILVFECKLDDLRNQKLIDPHFSENKGFISPIARFEPTERGWIFANTFMITNS